MNSGKSSDTNLGVRLRRRLVVCVAAIAVFSVAAIASNDRQTNTPPPPAAQSGGAQTPGPVITPIPFGELNGDDVYNASGAVPIADSRFLFCDNNANDSLFELIIAEDGQRKGPLIRRQLQGLAPDSIDDMEAMTIAEEKDRRFIFVTSSLSVKKSKDGQSIRVPPSGLLRVTINSDDSLSAENMPGFRDWFIKQAPIIAASATRIPDEGGLNIEGLAWDHERHALLFGLRTPLSAGNPIVIPVRVKDLESPWTTDNLKMLAPIQLMIPPTEAARGIRSIEYIPSRHAFLVVIGKAISGQKFPFALYEWKGGKRGKTHRLNVSFSEKMKPEGVTSGVVAGKPVILCADDGGGYALLNLPRHQ